MNTNTATIMVYIADDSVGCWARNEDGIWGPMCFTDEAWRELEHSGEARVVRQAGGRWELAQEANMGQFVEKLAEAAVASAIKYGLRVYPQQDGTVQVPAGTREREAAALALGAEIAPHQPTNDRTNYAVRPMCIHIEGLYIRLVGQSVETCRVPEGYEAFEVRPGFYRLRPVE